MNSQEAIAQQFEVVVPSPSLINIKTGLKFTWHPIQMCCTIVGSTFNTMLSTLSKRGSWIFLSTNPSQLKITGNVSYFPKRSKSPTSSCYAEKKVPPESMLLHQILSPWHDWATSDSTAEASMTWRLIKCIPHIPETTWCDKLEPWDKLISEPNFMVQNFWLSICLSSRAEDRCRVWKNIQIAPNNNFTKSIPWSPVTTVSRPRCPSIILIFISFPLRSPSTIIILLIFTRRSLLQAAFKWSRSDMTCWSNWRLSISMSSIVHRPRCWPWMTPLQTKKEQPRLAEDSPRHDKV